MPLIDNIWGKRFRFLLCSIDIYRKYIWVIPLKDKKGTAGTNDFLEILKESNRKPNKIWVNKGSEFYNKPMKSWLEKNALEMYSTDNEGKFVVPERFIRTLKNKIYKYMTSLPKNVYIDKLDDVVNKYNITYYNTIKMKPVDTHILTLVKKLMIKIVNLKLVILLEYQNIKTFLQKPIFQIFLKKFL